MSVNKVILIGRLGQNPDVRFTQGGMAVANFSVATSESWNDKNGQKQERTEWHKIVVWGKLAELCQQYLQKGRQAYIEGRLQTRQWQDKEGQTRYTTEVLAQTIQFLGGAQTGASAGAPNESSSRYAGGSGAQSAGAGYFGGGSSFSEMSASGNAPASFGQTGGFGSPVGGDNSFTEDDIPF